MNDEPDQTLDRSVVEELASTHYERMASELAGLSRHEFSDFSEWLSRTQTIHLNDAVSPEAKAGFLIALTGCIQEYLENEHGVSFQPRT